MKKLRWILSSLSVLGALLVLGWWFWPVIMPGSGEKVLYLALAAPLSGQHQTDGEAMLNGVRLYLEQAKQTGKLQDTQIELVVLNDQNSPQVATRVAADIASNDNVLLALGHYASNTSLAASDIYQQTGIPVITASASVVSLTQANEWYFRIVPNNEWQTALAANYIAHIVQRDSASIIFDKSAYGISLAENFVNACEDAGLRLEHSWSFDSQSEQLDTDLRNIIRELRALTDPGALFFATNEAEAVKIITSIKYPGTDYTIIGSDTFSTSTFIEEFKQYGQERVQAGYYTDGIYVISPFLNALGDNRAQDFRQAYIARYAEEPTWVAACYYDAAAIAVEAIKRADVYGKETIRNERKKIREALMEFSDSDVVIPGVTGDLYFDTHGDVKKPPVVGIYQKQQLLPAFSQFQLAFDQSGEKNSIYARLLGTNLIQYKDVFLTETDMVYTGIDVNAIENLDTKNLSYTLDFYLWFRFQEDLADHNITFPNALQPISLGEPLLEMTDNGISTRAYHIIGDFRSPFSFFRYPFDRQTLHVSLQHKTRPRNSLVYVRDVLGMSIPPEGQYEKNLLINGGAHWRVTDISHFEGSTDKVFLRQLGMSQTIPYSNFNLAIRIARGGTGWGIKSFFLIGLMFLFSYYVYFIPSTQFH
ncbi:MAG: ABC transporter substrate-binding protein, partial [bacterium]|nr:ABC transporter substrate-binding protein [bacterium]